MGVRSIPHRHDAAPRGGGKLVGPPSERTLRWFGDKSREELLLEIDRIITTDKPALSSLYERLDRAKALAHSIDLWDSDGVPLDMIDAEAGKLLELRKVLDGE